MSDVKQCDHEACAKTYRDGALRSLSLVLSPFGCGGRRLYQWERERDFCSAACALAALSELAGEEKSLDDYAARIGRKLDVFAKCPTLGCLGGCGDPWHVAARS